VVVVLRRYFSRFLTESFGRLFVCLRRPPAVHFVVSRLPPPPPPLLVLVLVLMLPLLALVLLHEQIAMPFIRPIQKAFFAGQCREMLRLVGEEG